MTIERIMTMRNDLNELRALGNSVKGTGDYDPSLLTAFAKTNDFTDAELIASPIFRKFDNTLLHQTNLISIAQTELNKVMGDGIPARSFAAGRNPISGNCVSGNILMSPGDTLLWPRIVDDQSKWYHSDICKLAFFYVHPIFKKIKEGDSQ